MTGDRWFLVGAIIGLAVALVITALMLRFTRNRLQATLERAATSRARLENVMALCQYDLIVGQLNRGCVRIPCGSDWNPAPWQNVPIPTELHRHLVDGIWTWS